VVVPSRVPPDVQDAVAHGSEALQAAQLGGGLLHAAQPALVPARLQVGRAVLLDQVGALVPRRCLKDPPGGNADGHGERRVR
jgi:hypothetical protein